jgi:hypothetical protein
VRLWRSAPPVVCRAQRTLLPLSRCVIAPGPAFDIPLVTQKCRTGRGTSGGARCHPHRCDTCSSSSRPFDVQNDPEAWRDYPDIHLAEPTTAQVGIVPLYLLHRTHGSRVCRAAKSATISFRAFAPVHSSPSPSSTAKSAPRAWLPRFPSRWSRLASAMNWFLAAIAADCCGESDKFRMCALTCAFILAIISSFLSVYAWWPMLHFRRVGRGPDHPRRCVSIQPQPRRCSPPDRSVITPPRYTANLTQRSRT